MPIYVYKCCDCNHEFEEYQHISDAVLKDCPVCKFVGSLDRVPTITRTDMTDYRNPIQMHSIGLAHRDEIDDFQRRNPDVRISRDENDPLYGVPIAESYKQKKQILKKEGFIDKNSF